jgi:ribonuclease P protein component
MVEGAGGLPVVTATFSKDDRLLDPKDFERVLKARKRVRKGPLVIAFAEGTSPHARLGLAVSKRHARHSVLRNRIKRHVREVFRTHGIRRLRLDCVAHLAECVDRMTVSRQAWQAHASAAFSHILNLKGYR